MSLNPKQVKLLLLHFFPISSNPYVLGITEQGLIWVVTLGWCQCGRQRGREEAAAARARAIGGREAGAGRWRWRPARAGDIASLSPALERPPGREASEREARGRRGTGGARARGESADESDVARSDWSTCRDLIGPRVIAVATSRF